MRRYSYSFLKDSKVPVSFLSLTNGIYALRSAETQKRTEHPQIFTRLKELAIVQSVKGSNAIEGIVTADKRIEEIVNHGAAPMNHSEQEIAGYRDALKLIRAEGFIPRRLRRGMLICDARTQGLRRKSYGTKVT